MPVVKKVPIPETNFVALAEDEWLTPRAIERKSIVIEDELLATAAALHPKPGETVVDIGAYIGDTARFWLDRGCGVVAFEPFSDAFECLSHNCPDAICINQAVGNGEGVMLAGCDSTYEWHKTNLGTRRCLVGGGIRSSIKLDQFSIPGRPTLIKIDVEGMEPFVLRGAKQTIAKYRPVLLIEVFKTALSKYAFTPQSLLNEIPADYRVEVAVGSESDDRYDIAAWPAKL